MFAHRKFLVWEQSSLFSRALFILCLILGGLALYHRDGSTGASAGALQTSPQWEYKVGWVVIDSTWDLAAEAKKSEDILNSKYGANGWELVGVLSMAISQNEIRQSDGTAFVAYKRRK